MARVRELRGQVREAIDEVRRVAGGRAPGAIAHGDLGAALRALARLSSGPQVLVAAEELTLPPSVQTCLYRIASEALTNALRHAGAHVVELRLHRAGAAVVLTVSDDGRGLPAVPAAGIGLASMTERAAELGGELTIRSRPGGGTRVRASLPLLTVLADCA